MSVGSRHGKRTLKWAKFSRVVGGPLKLFNNKNRYKLGLCFCSGDKNAIVLIYRLVLISVDSMAIQALTCVNGGCNSEHSIHSLGIITVKGIR